MFLDSAGLEDLTAATKLGFVTGVTMNPLLLRRAEVTDAREHLAAALRAAPGIPILYQPCSEEPETFLVQAREAVETAPDRIAIKVMALPPFYAVARKLVRSGVRCALTAVYTPGQALAAKDVGCEWVIPYVDRAARLLSGGEDLVQDLRVVLDSVDARTQILAASLKSGEQAVQALRDGANEVSVPLSVLGELSSHELSGTAAEGFAEAAAEIRW
ncbi:MAG: transaldolase [Actinomycetota bacterium]|nr:transaldolase [Actinomycetota bacterium]